MTQNTLLKAVAEISPEVVQKYSEAMQRWTGIWTDPAKTYLLRQRLQPILQAAGLDSHLDLLSKSQTDIRLRSEIIDALTTHETLFFRDHATLTMVTNRLIPERLAESRAGTVNVWSGGCSSGQEPYSLAMLLNKSTIENVKNRVRIIATDVSAKVIDRAKAGQYEEHELIRGLSAEYRRDFIHEADGKLELTPEIRRQVDFRVASLTDPKNPAGPFDVIFCRNVLIYFQTDDVRRIVGSLIDRLKPGGFLILGASEILPSSPDRYTRSSVDGVSVYQKS